jgi:5'-nucleotidase
VARLLKAGWPKNCVLNINFPCCAPHEVTEVEVTRQGFRGFNGMHAERRTDLRGRDYYWMGFRTGEPKLNEGADIAAIAAGKISVTPLHIDLTHTEALGDLKRQIGGSIPKAAP